MSGATGKVASTNRCGQGPDLGLQNVRDSCTPALACLNSLLKAQLWELVVRKLNVACDWIMSLSPSRAGCLSLLARKCQIMWGTQNPEGQASGFE